MRRKTRGEGNKENIGQGGRGQCNDTFLKKIYNSFLSNIFQLINVEFSYDIKEKINLFSIVLYLTPERLMQLSEPFVMRIHQ